VEGHIEAQAVTGKLSAQRICGGPGDGFTEVGGTYTNNLLEQGDSDESQGGSNQDFHGTAFYGCVDEKTHDLGINHLEADAAKKKDAQQDETPALWLDVFRQ
jgi:hypothetical protein